jgi:hypothetical protein
VKKAVAILVLVVVLGVGLLAGLGADGFHLGSFGVDWAPERATVKALAGKFLEDLKYKDFDKAGRYHTWEDQKTVDIPKLIERLFAVKPEQLNIHNIKITRADFDESGKRARTFFKCDLETLNTSNKPKKEGGKNKTREVEGILYWHKLPQKEGLAKAAKAGEKAKDLPPSSLQADMPGEGDERWFMRLESSLH